MRQVKRFSLLLLLFIVFSVLGSAVGFGVGCIVVTLNNEGLFATWKQLDGSLKFEQIVDVTSQTIWAQTSDGKIYSRGSSCYHEAQCNTWAETKEVPNLVYDGPEQPMIKSDSCQITRFRFLRKPPGNLV